MTKREAVKQLRAEDIKSLADAAEIGLDWHGWDNKARKAIKRAVKILRAVKAAQ